MTATIQRPLTADYLGGSADLALQEYRHVIEQSITNQPRSLQKRIGPSEIGNPCTHCLAAKLAGWNKTEEGIAWLPAIGTAVHEWLADLFTLHSNQHAATHQTGDRYLIEHRVNVGDIAGVDVEGSCDLFDVVTGTVIDHKIVGASTLNKARAHGPSQTYRTQANLYGRGWERAGYKVDHVAICFLPRNDVSLNNAVLWSEPYNEQIAIDALNRATRIATSITALTSISLEARDAWITGLDREPGCWDCLRYPDAPARQNPTQGFLDGLPTT